VSEPDIGDANEDELHAAMDRLLVRKRRIERNLAVRHLEEGAQILYDMRSSYNEAMTCPFYAPVRGSDEGSDPYQIPRCTATEATPWFKGSKEHLPRLCRDLYGDRERRRFPQNLVSNFPSLPVGLSRATLIVRHMILESLKSQIPAGPDEIVRLSSDFIPLEVAVRGNTGAHKPR